LIEVGGAGLERSLGEVDVKRVGRRRRRLVLFTLLVGYHLVTATKKDAE